MLMALADVVWPSMVLINELWCWWVIAIGLLVELIFLRFITNLSVKKLILADVLMNMASTVIGYIPILFGGMGVSAICALIYEMHFHLGTFNPISWAITYFFAVTINTAIEGLVIRFVFSQRMKWWGYSLLFIANAISVGMALWQVLKYPPEI